VKGSAPFLMQLFQNLFSNSIKFTRPEKTPVIQISYLDLGHCWEFEVKDNGPGFPEKDKETIFMLHRRLEHEIPGSGIGLSTCRKVMEIHQGQIWAESPPGDGAHFFFTLPKAL
jgi:signal transduction histidine kinase